LTIFFNGIAAVLPFTGTASFLEIIYLINRLKISFAGAGDLFSSSQNGPDSKSLPVDQSLVADGTPSRLRAARCLAERK
jgi:hypothetical protein